MAAGAGPARGGEFALSLVHPDDRDTLRATITEKLVNEFRYTVQYRMVRPDDGKTQWMESSAVILRESDGAPTRLIGVVRDISARKAEEEARDALVAELDHRVKNVPASVQSLAAQSARKTVSLESFPPKTSRSTGRVEAMAASTHPAHPDSLARRRNRRRGRRRTERSGPRPGAMVRAGPDAQPPSHQHPRSGPARAGDQRGKVRRALYRGGPVGGPLEGPGGGRLRTELDGAARTGGRAAHSARFWRHAARSGDRPRTGRERKGAIPARGPERSHHCRSVGLDRNGRRSVASRDQRGSSNAGRYWRVAGARGMGRNFRLEGLGGGGRGAARPGTRGGLAE